MAGIRSRIGGQMFEQSGATNVHNYKGGWKDWNQNWTKEQWQDWSKETGFPLA